MIPTGPFYIDDTLTFTANTHAPDTGAATDADAAPAYRVYEDETGTAVLTGNMAKLDDANTTGFYSEQITLSAANGFEVGKSYSVYASAAVGAVTGTVSGGFKVIAATYPANVTQWLGTAAATPTVAGVPEVDLTHVAGATTNVSALATNAEAIKAKTDNLPSDPADASVVAGLIAAVETKVDSILADTGTDGVVVAAGSKTGYALSAAGVDDIWDEVVDGSITGRGAMRILTASQAGKLTRASGQVTMRDPADTKDRITASVDDTGRTVVSVDLT